MRSAMTPGRQLRELLQQGEMVIAPGAYDCITARCIAQAGFSAVYMTGAGTAATLGYPDYGLVTMSEMVDNAGRIAASVEAPPPLEELAAVPKRVKGPGLLNVVWRGKTPEVACADAQAMGYRLAIVPGMLSKAVIGVCDTTLAELRRSGRHPEPAQSMT